MSVLALPVGNFTAVFFFYTGVSLALAWIGLKMYERYTSLGGGEA